MPKGKKKGKKKAKKVEKTEKSAKTEIETENVPNTSDTDDIFEDKEVLLKEKLFKVNKEIENIKLEIENTKEQNKALESECEKVRCETEVFSNYLNDLVEQRNTKEVTLHDYHQSKIEYYERTRTEMLDNYENKKSDLLNIYQKKDKVILDIQEKINEYDEYLIIRENQNKEISDLENQIKNIRCQQAAELEKMKVHLITEHQKFQQESNEKINEIARAAYKDALENLSKAFKNTETENRELRHEMLWTIKQNKLLHERKIKLLAENCKLKEEYQYALDFESFRQIRQEKPKLLFEEMNKNKF